MFDLDSLKMYEGPEFENEFTNYLVINENEIIIQKHDDKFYIGTIK